MRNDDTFISIIMFSLTLDAKIVIENKMLIFFPVSKQQNNRMIEKKKLQKNDFISEDIVNDVLENSMLRLFMDLHMCFTDPG